MLNLSIADKQTLIGKAIELNGSIVYHNTFVAPYINNMAAWEQKEYRDAQNARIVEMIQLKADLMANQNIFNEILVKYNMSTAVFIAKYLALRLSN